MCSAALLLLAVLLVGFRPGSVVGRTQLHGATRTGEAAGQLELVVAGVLAGDLGGLFEQGVDIVAGKPVGLEVEAASVGLAPLAGLLLGDLALEVLLVADYDEGEGVGVAGACVLEEVLLPGVEVLEGFTVAQVKNQDADVGAAEEGVTQTVESLLPGGVPALEGDLGGGQAEDLLVEVGANGGQDVLTEGAAEDGSLAHGNVAEENQLIKHSLLSLHLYNLFQDK